MRLLNRLRRRSEDREATEAPEKEVSCLHTALTPRWDTASDIGNEAKASAWVCGVCGQTFTPERAQEVRASEAERLKQVLHAG